MPNSKKIAFSCYVIALIPMYIGGMVYSLLSEYMPYHAIAVGHQWSELEPGLQLLILEALHGAGNLIIIVALAMSVLLAIPFRRGERWSYWSIPLMGCAAMLSGLSAAIKIDMNTPANPPWFVLVLVILLLITGLFFSLRGSVTSNN